MGLTIHYSGTIDRTEAIPQFAEELSDIADAMGWSAQPINLDEATRPFAASSSTRRATASRSALSSTGRGGFAR